MKDLNMEELTSQYFDVLKELGNIGAGNATTALAQMIGCKVDMSVPQVRLLEFKEVGEIVGGEEQIMVSIYLQVEGDVEGSIMFMLNKAAAAHMVNKLMGGMLGIDETNAAEYEFGEMECSAIKEVGNIITGAYLNALSGLTNLKIYPSVPQLGIDMDDELATIVKRSAGILDIAISPDGAYEIARRSRGTPRIANRLLKRVRDYAQVKGDGEITRDIADAALRMLEIDELGLDNTDRRMLETIIKFYDGGPVGLDTLAATVGEEAITLEDVYEPYLIQIGFINRTPRGRCVTRLAYEHLGIPFGGRTAGDTDIGEQTKIDLG